MRWFLFIILVSGFVYSGCDSRRKPETEVGIFWKKLTKVIKSGNKEKFKNHSLSAVECRVCLTNTRDERNVLNSVRLTDPEKWQTLQEEEATYIPIDTFLKSDFDLIFDEQFISRMTNSSSISFASQELSAENKTQLQKWIGDDKNYTLHEVLVSVGSPSSQNKGGQKVIQLLQTKGGFKFYGYFEEP